MTQPTSSLGPLSSDRAISDSKQDRYGVAQGDAQRLADVILALPQDQGAVIGLYGAWGSGKTGVFNLLEAILKESDDGTNFVVTSVNPWSTAAAGESSITTSLLAGLLDGLEDPGWLRKVTSKSAGKAQELFKELPKGYSALSVAFGWITTVYEVKKEIRKALSDKGLRAVVLVDDVDRLSGPEIKELFSAVKGVSLEMPVVYVLAMDEVEVARVVEKQLNIHNGREYLEKLVSVAVPVSAPGSRSIFRHLKTDLEKVLARIAWNTDELHSLLFWEEYYDMLAPHLKTPRDAVRLLNRITVTVSSAKALELSQKDYLAVEALAIYDPEFHEALAHGRSQALLIYSWRRSLPGSNEDLADETKKWFQPFLNNATGPEESSRIAFLGLTLSDLRDVLTKGYERKYLGAPQRAMQHADYYPLYFRYGKLHDDVLDSEVEACWRRFRGGVAWVEAYSSLSLETGSSEDRIELIKMKSRHFLRTESFTSVEQRDIVIRLVQEDASLDLIHDEPLRSALDMEAWFSVQLIFEKLEHWEDCASLLKNVASEITCPVRLVEVLRQSEYSRRGGQLLSAGRGVRQRLACLMASNTDWPVSFGEEGPHFRMALEVVERHPTVVQKASERAASDPEWVRSLLPLLTYDTSNALIFKAKFQLFLPELNLKVALESLSGPLTELEAELLNSLH